MKKVEGDLRFIKKAQKFPLINEYFLVRDE